MHQFILELKKFDWLLLIPVLLLVGLGLFSLYSSSLVKEDFLNFTKQLVFLGIGLFLFFAFSFFDYRVFKVNPYIILILYFTALFSLIGLFFFAPEIRGTKSWYQVGPFSLDPIEFTKIVLIILLAKYFSMRHIEMYQMRHILISGLYVSLPAILVFLQPNLGSAILLITIWLGILIFSGIKLRHFLILSLVFVLLLVLGWNFLLKDYQKERILSFIFPEMEPLGAGWSQQQAKIAIGSGGPWGRGVLENTQVRYGFLPESRTDFVFASLGEKLGFLGAGFLFLLFSLLLWRVIRVAQISKDNFARFFAAGFAVSLTAQIFINISMNIGILPVIGISLPFVSYGGSALIMDFLTLGILESIFRQSR